MTQDVSRPCPEEILQAAKELGEALGANADVRGLIQAETELESSTELRALDGELQRVYEDLVRRQRAGEVLSPQEINGFQKLKEQLLGHPLVIERDARLKAVQGLFGQAGSTISSVLGFDYTTLAGK